MIFSEWGLSFYFVSPKDQTQACQAWWQGGSLYLLSYLGGSKQSLYYLETVRDFSSEPKPALRMLSPGNSGFFFKFRGTHHS